jgi:non-specific serine/threonine protein kinase
MDVLTHLVDKSLVNVERAQGQETRYRMLETVRQYAREKLLETGSEEMIRRQHLAYFVKLAEQSEPELYRSNQVFWLNKLDDDLDNFRTALEWALASDVEAGLQIAVAPRLFWSARGYSQELGEWLRQLLDRYDVTNSLHARALVAYCSYLIVDRIRARNIAEQGLQMARMVSDKQTEALSLCQLGVRIFRQGNFREGIPMVEQSLVLFQSLGDQLGQASALEWLSRNLDDLERSKAYILESLRLYRELGHLSGIAACLNALASRTVWGGDFSAPLKWLDEARTIYRQLRDRSGEAAVLEYYGALTYWRGDYQRAYAYYQESFELFESVGDYWPSAWAGIGMAYALLRQGDISKAKERFGLWAQRSNTTENIDLVIYALEGLASLNVKQGQPERAARLFAWTKGMRAKLDDQNPPVQKASIERDLAIIRAQLDDATFQTEYEAGRKMTMDEAIEYALSEV